MHIARGQGSTYDLGVATMRLLTSAEQAGGHFALAEFCGREGPWTVPHIHRHTAESFFVLDGGFTFTLGQETIHARAGDYVLVPAGTTHVLGAEAGGGTALVLWVPGGLEKMFVELSQLSPEAILDPATRAQVASRHDSVPA